MGGFFRAHQHSLTPLLPNLNRLIAYSMLNGESLHFEKQRDRYDKLLGLPTFRGRVAFISVNYDMLLEEAMMRAGLEPAYWGTRGPDGKCRDWTGTPIFKLHGSINWLRHIVTAAGSNFAVVQAQSLRNPSVINSGPHLSVDSQVEDVQLERVNVIAEMKLDTTKPPVLAFYSEGKPLESNYRPVKSSTFTAEERSGQRVSSQVYPCRCLRP